MLRVGLLLLPEEGAAFVFAPPHRLKLVVEDGVHLLEDAGQPPKLCENTGWLHGEVPPYLRGRAFQ